MDIRIQNAIEAIIFASEQPVKKQEIKEILAKSSEADSEAIDDGVLAIILDALLDKYKGGDFPFQIKAVAGGYQFFTKADYHPYVQQAITLKNQKKLSKAALETLAIVAYKQPVTKTEIEHIRGVNSDYAVHKLLDKQLISIQGRSNAPGKPLLYATTDAFLQYLGLNELGDLPKPAEFAATAEENLPDFQSASQN